MKKTFQQTELVFDSGSTITFTWYGEDRPADVSIDGSAEVNELWLALQWWNEKFEDGK